MDSQIDEFLTCIVQGDQKFSAHLYKEYAALWWTL